jgi:hypothetical protein
MSDKPLFRNGKVTTKMRKNPDGSTLLYKPFLIKPEHLMKMTGAPGWDKGHVDEVFTDGVVGGLRFSLDIVQYDIPIAEFREHAFEKATPGFGDQYHVHLKYYKSTGLRTVSPRRTTEVEEGPRLPPKLAFGEWIPCTNCGSTGKKQKERCPKCQGLGFINWSSATSSPATTTQKPG